jgi:hypothetical protein
MSTENKVFNKLFKSEKVELESNKFEFALTDDFNLAYNKANDDQTKILTNLVDALDKAQTLLKENASQWNKASVIGKQLADKSKELGVTLPANFLNGIKISEKGIKESQTYIAKISQLMSSF